jgi:hypothetical protein
VMAQQILTTFLQSLREKQNQIVFEEKSKFPNYGFLL